MALLPEDINQINQLIGQYFSANLQAVKLSTLPLASTLEGLHTMGVDATNNSVRVSLQFVKDATTQASDAADLADQKAAFANGKALLAIEAAGAANTAAAATKPLRFIWDETRLGLKFEGDPDFVYTDLKGATGNSLEFAWNGTRLGVRVEGQPAYTEVELGGKDAYQIALALDPTIGTEEEWIQSLKQPALDAAEAADAARLAIENDLAAKAAHGYGTEPQKTLKEVDDSVSQLAGDLTTAIEPLQDEIISLIGSDLLIEEREGWYGTGGNTFYSDPAYHCWKFDVTTLRGKFISLNALGGGAKSGLKYSDNTYISYASYSYPIYVSPLATVLYVSNQISLLPLSAVTINYSNDGDISEINQKIEDLEDILENDIGCSTIKMDTFSVKLSEPGTQLINSGRVAIVGNLDYVVPYDAYVTVNMFPAALNETHIIVLRISDKMVLHKYTFTPTALEYTSIKLPFIVEANTLIMMDNVGYSAASGALGRYINPETTPDEGDIIATISTFPNYAFNYNLDVRRCRTHDEIASLEERVTSVESRSGAALKTKKWVIIGDSRSAWMYNEADTYYSHIANYMGGLTKNATNKVYTDAEGVERIDWNGTNGSYTMKFIYGPEGANPALLDRVRITAPDVVSVYMGVNDYAMASSASPLGSITDNKETASFYGNCKKAIESIYAKFLDCKIVFLTPQRFKGYTSWAALEAVNANGNTLDQYAQAIKDVCGLYSVPVIDILHEGDYTPVIPLQKVKYFSDGLHENALGHQRIANKLYPVLNELLTI